MTKNDNFKEYGMPVVVLVAICFVTTLLLALTNSVSEPIIIKNAAITATANRKELLPDADDFTQLELDSYATSSDGKAAVTEVYKTQLRSRFRACTGADPRLRGLQRLHGTNQLILRHARPERFQHCAVIAAGDQTLAASGGNLHHQYIPKKP